MNAMRGLLVGMLLALCVTVFAAESGGFPSRPIFQAVTVGSITTAARSGLTVNSNNSNESFVAAADAAGSICISNNGSAVPGCGNMPAGNAGVASNGNILLHASLGTVATDAALFTSGGSTANAAAVQALSKAAGDSSVYASINGVSNTCIESNRSGAAGACGMPNGDDGISTPNGTLFLHPGNGILATDATTVPWATGHSYAIDASIGATATLNTCTRCGSSPSVTRAAAGSYHFVHNIGTLTFFSCTLRTTAGTPQNLIVGITLQSSTDLTVSTVSTAGALTDPAANTLVDCIGIN